jgi:hypothetical protein
MAMTRFTDVLTPVPTFRTGVSKVSLGGQEVGADDVAHVREVATLLAGAEHAELLAGQSGLDHSVDGHVGPLLRAVHAEVLERDRRKREHESIRLTEVVTGQLRPPRTE